MIEGESGGVRIDKKGEILGFWILRERLVLDSYEEREGWGFRVKRMVIIKI